MAYNNGFPMNYQQMYYPQGFYKIICNARASSGICPVRQRRACGKAERIGTVLERIFTCTGGRDGYTV